MRSHGIILPSFYFRNHASLTRWKNSGGSIHVGEKQPFQDKYLKERVLGETRFQQYADIRKTWKNKGKKEGNWKEFVKLARFYDVVPEGKKVVHGWLHDCESTDQTDRCREPKMDEDRWEQYCFK
jgi:hypothetical protein